MSTIIQQAEELIFLRIQGSHSENCYWLLVWVKKLCIYIESLKRIFATNITQKKLRQMLSEVARTKQGTLQPVLCSLKNKAAECLKFFFWWKNFTIDVKINIWNDWWLAHVPENVLIIGRTKFPMNVHVLTDVSSKSDVMPPWFFKKGENFIKEVYLHFLTNIVKLWMEIVLSGKPYVFQQDNVSTKTGYLFQN